MQQIIMVEEFEVLEGIAKFRDIANLIDKSILSITISKRGVEKIVYDFSKMPSKYIRKSHVDLDKEMTTKYHVQIRFAGIETAEVQKRFLSHRYEFHKHIIPDLEYAIKY